QRELLKYYHDCLHNDPEFLPSPAARLPNFCLEPPYTGFCKARKIRYFYDAKSRLCKTFIYGGCGARQNNFLTAADCMWTCGGAHGALE
uniref:BPTI/Kunitz inhibitor domain-containing protein n=1 Tax=Catagonus wagneri TaxID=51154 RepID=A0A8C3VVC1_9CETA